MSFWDSKTSLNLSEDQKDCFDKLVDFYNKLPSLSKRIASNDAIKKIDTILGGEFDFQFFNNSNPGNDSNNFLNVPPINFNKSNSNNKQNHGSFGNISESIGYKSDRDSNFIHKESVINQE